MLLRASTCLLLLLVPLCTGFVPHHCARLGLRVTRSRLLMSTTEDPPTHSALSSKPPATITPAKEETAIVLVSKENVEATSSIFGAALGLILFGPVGAAVLAAVTNYVSKKEGELGEATRGIASTTLQLYNFLSKINAKYGVTGTLAEATSSVYNNLKKDSDVLDQAEITIKSTVEKAVEFDKDYDLLAKTKSVLWQAGNISNEALKKVEELNEEYSIVEKAKEAAVSAAEKIKQTLKDQTE